MHLFRLFLSFVTNINLPLHVATYAVSTRVVLDSFFRDDSTLTHMTIQVTQLRLNSNPKFANLTQLRLNSKPNFNSLTQV